MEREKLFEKIMKAADECMSKIEIVLLYSGNIDFVSGNIVDSSKYDLRNTNHREATSNLFKAYPHIIEFLTLSELYLQDTELTNRELNMIDRNMNNFRRMRERIERNINYLISKLPNNL